MRRSVLTLAAAALLLGASAPAASSTADEVDCNKYCGEKAAEHCERIDSWKCTWYIAGCLGGCNIKKL